MPTTKRSPKGLPQDNAALPSLGNIRKRASCVVLTSSSSSKVLKRVSEIAKKKTERKPSMLTQNSSCTDLEGLSVKEQIQKLLLKLSLSHTPLNVVCRRTERQTLLDFCRESISQKQGAAIYISGRPGCGKTATFYDVLKTLNESKLNFECATINAMSVTDPRSIFAAAFNAFTEESVALKDSETALEAYLFRKSPTMKVLCIDEVDQLLCKDQAVLYTLFEWASMPLSNLVLIGIANALDLTDRFLPRLRARNCLPQCLPFVPYSAAELQAIVSDRMGAFAPLIADVALELCARRIAGDTSDVRKMLDVCSYTLNLAARDCPALLEPSCTLESVTPLVTTAMMSKALTTSLGSPAVEAIRALPFHQQLVLCATTLLARASHKLSLADVSSRYTQLCQDEKLAPLSLTLVGGMCASLADAALVAFDANSSKDMFRQPRLRPVRLLVLESDVKTGLNDVACCRSWLRVN